MIVQQHQAYQQWLRELRFYKEEMVIFEKELNLLIERHPNLLSIIEHVEEYQKIFKQKVSKLDLLNNRIMAKEQNLSSAVNQNDDDLQAEFEKIQREKEDFVSRMETLKKNFRRFVAKNMH